MIGTPCTHRRFIAEEAFSFRIREVAPDALRVLDMQDCHALRSGIPPSLTLEPHRHCCLHGNVIGHILAGPHGMHAKARS